MTEGNSSPSDDNPWIERNRSKQESCFKKKVQPIYRLDIKDSKKKKRFVGQTKLPRSTIDWSNELSLYSLSILVVFVGSQLVLWPLVMP